VFILASLPQLQLLLPSHLLVTYAVLLLQLVLLCCRSIRYCFGCCRLLKMLLLLQCAFTGLCCNCLVCSVTDGQGRCGCMLLTLQILQLQLLMLKHMLVTDALLLLLLCCR
jgi:hypothetical protein